MATRSVATVFGGSGFIGRYVVKRLAHKGFVVRVAVRDPEAALFLKTAGGVGQVVPLFASVENEATVHRAVEGAGLVVNLVGILAEGAKGDFQRIHAEGAGRIARLAAAAGVDAAGAHLCDRRRSGQPKPLRHQQGGRRASGAGGVPRRDHPAPVDRVRAGGRFFNRFAAIARLSPLMPVICGETKLQPVYVGDVADAAMAALGRLDSAGATYELGGPRVWTFRELLSYIMQETGSAPG